jgi:hypothetical protein
LGADFIKALMIDQHMLNDPFVQSKLKSMLTKKINDSKMGVLQVEGNFSLMSGDPFILCQSIFGIEPTGLLKKNEFYSKYWNDRKTTQVVGFRSPMSCHNNIRTLNLVNNDDVNYWYKYMSEVTILNAWDLTCASFNGSDFDGDMVFTTNNKVLLNNTRKTLPIMCNQRKGKKVLINNQNLVQSDMRGFGDEIGSTTNKITAMFDVKAQFNEDSNEYKTLEYRIMCGQKFQQDAIDKIKGIECKSMPKYWYNAHDIEGNDTFNKSIVANKKPYFFIYNYPELKKEYTNYYKLSSQKCLMKFGKPIESLLNNISLSEDEMDFINWYKRLSPITDNDSTMNLICHKVEKSLNNVLNNAKFNTAQFDYTILKNNDYAYSTHDFECIKAIYNEYKEKTQSFKVSHKGKSKDKYSQYSARAMFQESFKAKAFEICNNKYVLANIVLDLCYTNNYSKQFAWDICGDVFVENLLDKNNRKIKYLEMVDDDFQGEYITYNGHRFVERFKMVDVCEE